jgi:hypothetical protein
MDKNKRIQSLINESKEVADPHRQFYKVYFEDNSMNFAFQWLLAVLYDLQQKVIN